MNGLLLTILLFQFNISADVFYPGVTQELLSKLPVASVVVMDNETKRYEEKCREGGGTSLNSCPLIHPILIPLISHGRNSNPFAIRLDIPLMIFLPKYLHGIFLYRISYMGIVN